MSEFVEIIDRHGRRRRARILPKPINDTPWCSLAAAWPRATPGETGP